jgi:hypothetical protein
VIIHIPEPRRHLVSYYGWYSNVSRGRRKRQKLVAYPQRAAAGFSDEDRSPDARALRRRWAEMISRVYEVDPLVCPRCHGEMRIIASIVDAAVIDKILSHLVAKGDHRVRGPPGRDLIERTGL